MHSFPLFTRSTLLGKFTWVRAIIFGGNFMVREFLWQRSIFQGQFSSEAIVQRVTTRSGRGGQSSRGNCPGDSYQEVNFPRGLLSYNHGWWHLYKQWFCNVIDFLKMAVYNRIQITEQSRKTGNTERQKTSFSKECAENGDSCEPALNQPILFNAGLYRSAFSTDSFEKLLFLCYFTVLYFEFDYRLPSLNNL